MGINFNFYMMKKSRRFWEENDFIWLLYIVNIRKWKNWEFWVIGKVVKVVKVVINFVSKIVFIESLFIFIF